MDAQTNIVDQSNTNVEEISQPTMKIERNDICFNPLLNNYLDELQMLVQVLNDFVLNHALSASFGIPTMWLSLGASAAIYNRTTGLVTFQLSSNKTTKLTKNQFSQILKFPPGREFVVVTNAQGIYMFNDMGHPPTLLIIS